MDHLNPDDLDAMAHSMLEDPLAARAAAHVVSCASCRERYEVRLAEAQLLYAQLSERRAEPARRLHPLAYAAVLLLAVGAAYLGRRTDPGAERKEPLQATRHQTFRLDDGSEIVASVPPAQLGWRNVRLTPGDYYFDVVSMAGMPFYVVTDVGEIRVLGTRFRVRYEEKKMNGKVAAVLAVVVIGGAVILLNDKGSTTLRTGEAGEISGRKLAPQKSQNPSALLAGESPQARIARLESELARANSEVRRLKRDELGADHANQTPPKDLQPGALRAEFTSLLRKTYAGTATEKEAARLSEFTRDATIMQTLVGDLEARIQGDPNDLEARLGLVEIDSARLHASSGSIAERSRLGKRIGRQLGEVLKRDPENWNALYQQAIGTSHSRRDPAGQAEAVRQFEHLRDLQERGPVELRHSATYVQLAMIHASQKNMEQAREVIRAGIRLLPDDAKLRDAEGRLASAESR